MLKDLRNVASRKTICAVFYVLYAFFFINSSVYIIYYLSIYVFFLYFYITYYFHALAMFATIDQFNYCKIIIIIMVK